MTTTGQERMRAIHDETAGPLLRYLLKVTLGNRPLAEDLMQETYLRAWHHIDRLPDDPAQARPWLYTVARRIAIDTARAREVRPAEIGVSDLTELIEVGDPAERVVAVELVRRALPALARAHREILVEVFYHERTPPEIAVRLGIPEGTVKSRTFYALRSLGAAIGETPPARR